MDICTFWDPVPTKTSTFGQQYSVQSRLDDGRYSSVYRCIERSSGKLYAVKMCDRYDSTTSRAIKFAQREISILMGIQHPNIIGLKDAFEDDAGIYIILELAPEGSLYDWIIANEKLTERQAKRVFQQLFEGLQHLVSVHCGDSPAAS
jgi:serine/threonine-protein kinase CHEK2